MASKTHKAVNLQDIAERADVSIATVSKVLNGRSDVSDMTRSKVQKLLDDNQYTRRVSPNHRNDLIEIVFEKFDNLWGLELLTGAIKEGRRLGLNVVISENGSRSHPDPEWIDGVLKRRPYGVILVFSDLTPTEKKKLAAAHIPLATVDPYGDPAPENKAVLADNWTGGLLATRHLLSLGHTRIGVITGPMEMMCSKARLDGYSAALEERGLTVDPNLIRSGDFTTPGGYKQALTLLKDPQTRPSAIFAQSDLEAMGIYEAARQLNIRIPQDLSLIGFDDLQLSGYMGPALTTIRQPLHDMAASATRMLIDARSGAESARRVILPTTLIQRDSTRRFTAPPED